MADGYKFTLRGNREAVIRAILAAPAGSVVSIEPARRTLPQNDKMHAMLSELAAACPDGRRIPPHKWKALAMDAAGFKPDWERSLDGESVVCVGYKSSRLSKEQFSDLIECIASYAAQHGVELKD